MCYADEGFDAGVNVGENSGPSHAIEGQMCAHASGAGQQGQTCEKE